MNRYMNLYTQYQIDTFFQKLLSISIFVFIFSIPFNPHFSKLIINQMFYFWILSLEVKYLIKYIKENHLLQILFLFSIFIYSSYLWSEEPLYVNYVNLFLKFLFLPTIILVTSMKQKYIFYYISIFLFAMFLNELISYGIFFEYIHGTLFGFHITGTKFDPIPFQTSHMEYSVYISFTIFILLHSLFHKKWSILSSIYIFFSLTMITNLFLSAGRSGQFTFLITSILLSVIYFRNTIKYILLAILSLVLTLIVAYNTSSTFNYRINHAVGDIQKVIHSKNYNSSFGIRLSSYALVQTILNKTPLLYGEGYNDTDRVVQELHKKEFFQFAKFHRQEGHLHNTYITIYVALGLSGLVLVLYILYMLLTLKINDSFIHYLRYVFVFTIFFAGFTENMFREKEIMLLFATFFSIILSQVNYENRKDIQK